MQTEGEDIGKRKGKRNRNTKSRHGHRGEVRRQRSAGNGRRNYHKGHHVSI